jgi:hypothetical protein
MWMRLGRKERGTHAIALGIHDAFREEGRADCACCAGGGELVLYESVNEGCFAYALGAKDYDLCFEGLRHCLVQSGAWV